MFSSIYAQEEAIEGLSGKKQYIADVADIYCHIGFCLCKLRKNEDASHNFQQARYWHQINGSADLKNINFIKLILQHAENEFWNKNYAISKSIFRQGLSAVTDFIPGLSNVVWSSIHMQIAFYLEYVDVSLHLAEDRYNGVLDYTERTFHDRHPAIAQSMLCLSRVALKQEKLDRSEDYAFKCLKIGEDLFTDPLVKIFDQLLLKRNNLNKEKTLFLNYSERFSKMQIFENSLFIACLSTSPKDCITGNQLHPKKRILFILRLALICLRSVLEFFVKSAELEVSS